MGSHQAAAYQVDDKKSEAFYSEVGSGPLTIFFQVVPSASCQTREKGTCDAGCPAHVPTAGASLLAQAARWRISC